MRGKIQSLLNKLFQLLDACFKPFEEREAHIPHHFAPREAGWCPWPSCVFCVAAEGERKVGLGLGDDCFTGITQPHFKPGEFTEWERKGI